MLKLGFILILVLGSSVMAKESWLCSEDSSQVRGSDILACGIGEADTQSVATSLALNNAKNEFNAVCDNGTECALHSYTVEPRRATCEEFEGKWKCFRLVVYRVINKDRHNSNTIGAHTDPMNFVAYNPSVRNENMDLMDAVIKKQLLELGSQK